MDVRLLLLFVLAGAVAAAVIIWAIRQSAQAKAAIRDAAQQHGWTVEEVTVPDGTDTIIRDPGADWTLRLVYRSSRQSHGNNTQREVTRYTSFEVPDLLFPGMAVLGPDVPDSVKKMADTMMGFMGGDLGRWLLDKITEGLGAEAKDLRTVEGPGSGTLMAAPGAEAALDALRELPELLAAREGAKEADQPIVMRGRFGLSVRKGGRMRQPDEITTFVAFGQRLAAALRG